MKIRLKSLLFWAPRILCILFALFLMVFSLDVFGHGYSFAELALGLLIHNLPTLALFLILYLTWKREWIGGVLFTALGVFYIADNWNKFDYTAFLLIGGPPILIGILFILNWAQRVKQSKAGGA
jgi:hypothetical protein